MFPILLASASPRRRALLAQIGFDVQVHAVDVDESWVAGERGDHAAQRLARKKAAAALRSAAPSGPRIGLAADTVVWDHDGARLGKPASDDEAIAMIGGLAGRTHNVTSAYTLFDTHSGETVDGAETTKVTFRSLTDAQIRGYVATGEPADKAGGYGIQGFGAVLVERVDGCYANVVGLPVSSVCDTLRRTGWLDAWPWEAQ